MIGNHNHIMGELELLNSSLQVAAIVLIYVQQWFELTNHC